jgi:hypothetical protein
VSLLSGGGWRVVEAMKLFCNINIMNNQKSYKIVVRSKKIRNICGANPAEVAKKVALKLLVKNIYSMYFSIMEIKTNKIIHYQSNKKELVRPYHKNGKLVKYRIIIKKMGKQVGGTYQPNLENPEDPIFMFFPDTQYVISFEENEDYGRIIHITDLNKKNCLQIIFDTSRVSGNVCIELFKLNRCHFQGSANLKTLIKYAKYLKNTLKINLNYITLEDASIIPDTNIRLWLLSILTTGKSWYNQFGFTSVNYHNELRINSEIIEMNIMDFINQCIERTKLKRADDNLNNDINDSLIERIMSFFEKYNKSKSVKDVFIEIKNQLKENRISCEDTFMIGKILEIIYLSSIIRYYWVLYYTIPEE